MSESSNAAVSDLSSSEDRYSQLLMRMESIPFSRWHVKLRVIVGTASFFDGYGALSLAYALPVLISLWHLNTAQSGMLIAAGYLGQAVGAIIFGVIAERFGRVFGIKASMFMMSIMGIACMFAGNYTALFILRFLQGIGLGGEVPVAATYINELSAAHGRGKFFIIFEIIFPVSLMLTAQLGAVIVPSFGWRWLFLLGGAVGMILLPLFFKLKESPRWLISKGKLDEAECVIEEIEASTDKRLPVTTIASKPTVKANWKELFSPFYRFRTLVVWALWFSAYFISNGLNNWLPSLYKTVYKLPLKESLYAASITNVLQVVMVLACAFLIDKVGRKRWATFAFIAAGCLLLILFITGAKSAQSVMYLGSSAYGIIGSITVLLYLYTPEIYPTRMRAIGTAFATTWLRLASAIGPMIIGFVLDAKGISYVFVGFAAICIIGSLVATRMIETSGKALEDIAP
ncbi:MFS transporter [Clostridium coskatii]|uniref:Inner membrane metabolite transport protein YdjE n=1 Tax=Clostridium coskatii TaxID=1705578 RepID=A0A168Q9M9_9CLOT|nr:MFS transporter [Clostridium coskatii]OAA88813.1 Inner membrane metabolite transport protein YdjE [Clostridium coskatii]OBR93576.1 inner membrane metabolite transport protein YdjE [Clostridium coskatii]